MTWKKAALIGLVVFVILAGIGGALHKQAMTRAALTQAVLIERAQKLSQEREALRVKFDLLGKISTLKILEKEKAAAEAVAEAQKIKVKSAGEIARLRTLSLTWQEKYNLLEPECLKQSDVILGLNYAITLKDSAIEELKSRDLIRLEYIDGLQKQLTECETLLDKSLKNTASILKRPWLWRVFDNVEFGPGLVIGTDGKARIGLAMIYSIK